MVATSPQPVAPSPNQRARREQIIDGAVRVLRRDGLSGCTSRPIAEASGVAKSALHYYFQDTEEIVDAAFRRLMAQFQARVEAASASAPEPRAALRAAASTYLHLGSAHHSAQVPMLWFEVQLQASRCGDTRGLQAMTAGMLALLGELVASIDGDAGSSAAAARTRVLLSALVGILVRDALEPLDLDDALDECLCALGLAHSSAV